MIAKEMITSSVITVPTDCSIKEVARVMRDNTISGVTVVGKGKVVGIVTRTDLVRLIEPLEIAMETSTSELLEQ